MPLSFSAKAPAAVADLPGDGLEQRLVISPDQCVIDGRRFYLRGRLAVPIHGCLEPFIWGVWAEISATDFYMVNQRWTTPGREADPPFPGYLDTDIPFYGRTLTLQVTVHTQPVGRRPHFVVSDPEHPLAREQSKGVTLDRVKQIAAAVLHGKVGAIARAETQSSDPSEHLT